MSKTNRLSFRVPWLVEARAEGTLAILTLAILTLASLVIAVLVAKALGLW